jgi:MerT mercuric transport protein
MNDSSTNSCCEPARTPAVLDNVAIGRTQKLVAAEGILGAIAASACCIAPLALFSLGISGAWIGNLTALAPYQPYFIAATLACLGYGYWLVYRRNSCLRGRRSLCPAAAEPYRQGGPHPGDDPRRRRDCLRLVCSAFAELLRRKTHDQIAFHGRLRAWPHRFLFRFRRRENGHAGRFST